MSEVQPRFNIGDVVQISLVVVWIVQNVIVTPPPRWEENGVSKISYCLFSGAELVTLTRLMKMKFHLFQILYLLKSKHLLELIAMQTELIVMLNDCKSNRRRFSQSSSERFSQV